MRSSLVIMIYDVVCDRRRARLHGLLREYGVPVQKSAFEARLTPAERRRLVADARRMLDAGEDSLILYVIHAGQEAAVETIGRPRPPIDVPEWIVA